MIIGNSVLGHRPGSYELWRINAIDMTASRVRIARGAATNRDGKRKKEE
jgi:hypothetical protein